MLIKRYRELSKQGILGINRRNADYVLKYNPRRYYPLVDDKLKTKQLALKKGIAVPALYEVIHSEHQLKQLNNLLAPYADFVIKPAHGAGGDGIVVIKDRAFGHYRQINGKLITEEDLKHHLSHLLSGAFSLGGHQDYAIIENRVKVDTVFHDISYEGVPDIRIITLLGYPAMAMVRLPTRLSNGKANLHQGAIGAGINLATGKTFGGVFHNNAIDCHPDTLNPIENVSIPHWENILALAASCYDLTGLGYLGVDIVLDKELGPMMLELNARPGLNIQIANREGAFLRYQAIEREHQKGPKTLRERISFCQQTFHPLSFLSSFSENTEEAVIS